MSLTPTERSLIEDQMARDTLWCLRCGLRGRRTEADCEYTVEGLPHLVPACKECLETALSEGLKVSSSAPVVRPAYVGLLRRLMGAA